MKIYELLNSPDKWCQGSQYRDKLGNVVDSKDAYSYCLAGAMSTCWPDTVEYLDVWGRINTFLHINSMTAWNDAEGRTYEDVISLCKRLDV